MWTRVDLGAIDTGILIQIILGVGVWLALLSSIVTDVVALFRGRQRGRKQPPSSRVATSNSVRSEIVSEPKGAHERTKIEKRPRRPGLVLFIHGIDGSEATSFGMFPQLVRDDPAISEMFDVEAFDYEAALLAYKGTPHPSAVAAQLGTTIDASFTDYHEIVIVAHSYGGLVTRRYIADALMAGQPPKVSRVIYFATGHMGSVLATLAGPAAKIASAVVSVASIAASPWVSGAGTVVSTAIGMGPSEALKAQAIDSIFLQDLMQDEASCGAIDYIAATYVRAAEDRYVGPTSSWGVGPPGLFGEVGGTDHFSLVKPESHDHGSFKIVKNALLDPNPRRPWEAQPDHRQPILSRRLWASQSDPERHRYVYWRRVLPFIGRADLAAPIAMFLGGHGFRWMLLAGPGGMGKSRLALELVLGQTIDFMNAGFLEVSSNFQPNWALWQPRLPTLIIIDYASRDADAVAAMFKGLAEREPPHLLCYPVRVILLERDAEGDWLNKITSMSPLLRHDITRAQNLVLPPIDDVWPIFEHVLGRDAPELAGREATLRKLTEIDKEHRPLFAFFMADAMRDSGGDVLQWNRSALLVDVIDRWRRNFWLPVAKRVGLGDHENALAKEERALALATMMATPSAPLTREELAASKSPFMPIWDIDRHPRIFAVMTSGDARAGIQPLEPDIVGEFFVLEMLRNMNDSDARALAALACKLRPENTWRFLRRCIEDFQDHPALPAAYMAWLTTRPTMREWGEAAQQLIFQLHVHSPVASVLLLSEELKTTLLRKLSEAHDEPESRKVLANVAAGFVNILCFEPAMYGMAREVYVALKILSKAHDEPALRLALAKSTTSFAKFADFGKATEPAALELYEDLKVLSTAHNEPELRLELAKSALLIANALTRKKGMEAAALWFYEDLRMLSKAHDEPALREELAKSAANLTFGILAARPPDRTMQARASDLYEELKTLAKSYDEPELRGALSRAVVNLTYFFGSDREMQALALELYEHLKMLSTANDEPALRRALVCASFNVINACDLTWATQIFAVISDAAGRPDASRELKAASAWAYAVALQKAAQNDRLEDPIKETQLPPQDIALAGQVLFHRHYGNCSDADALVSDIKASCSANVVSSVEQLLAAGRMRTVMLGD